MQDMNIIIGQQAKSFTDAYDEHRVERQERRSLTSTKEARTARKEEQTAQLQEFQEEESPLYGPGIAD